MFISSAALLLIFLTRGNGWRKLRPSLCLKTLVSWKRAKVYPRSTNSSSTSASPPAHTKHRKVYAVCLKTSTSCASIESTHGPCGESEGRQPSRGVCFALLRFYVSGDTTRGNITNLQYHLSISGKNWKWENVKFSQSSPTEIPSLGFLFSKSLNYCSKTSSATSQSPFRMSCKEGIYTCLCQYPQS